MAAQTKDNITADNNGIVKWKFSGITVANNNLENGQHKNKPTLLTSDSYYIIKNI